MPKVTVDGREVEVPPGATVLQAAELAGAEIPRFCYHERLSIAGNCRMCLVEIEKAPKPVASCAYPIAEGMVVKTDTPMVRNARRGVMEFLLINHPLDCPICDQGGECDLQDQAMGYGMDRSRYAENKRAVKDKYLGPLVKTIMTRCIHCTRCIRFAHEIAGVPELGATSRGENMEVTTYVEHALTSELSGNLIDICPVGALTSKPYAFIARPWELKKTDGIDALDAVGANIRIDTRGPEVLRILPRINEDVNEEWLGDKSRFAIDGLKRRRLDACWIRRDGRMVRATWPEALGAVAARLKDVRGERIGGIAGELCDAESMLALKDVLDALGSPNVDCRQLGEAVDASRPDFYSFNSSIAGIDEAGAFVLIGTNPRREAPLINQRIRRRWLHAKVPVIAVGPSADLTYDAEWLGDSPDALARIAERLSGVAKPMVIVGQSALRHAAGAAILASAWKLAGDIGGLTPEWHGFNVLQTAASRVGALFLGLLPGTGGKNTAEMMAGGVDVLWLLGADELDSARIAPGTFVVYQGHHGDRGASRADVILPGAAYTEKRGTYVNTEGRAQRCEQATYPPGEAREDWKILRAFSAAIGCPLPYDTLDALRARLEHLHPAFTRIGTLPRFGCSDLTPPAGDPARLGTAPFVPAVANYYQTDPISRASATMAECTRVLVPPVLQAAAE